MRFIRSNKRTASLHLRRAEVLKCPLGLAPFWYELHAKYPLGFSSTGRADRRCPYWVLQCPGAKGVPE